MTRERMSILCTGVLLATGAGVVSGEDWPEWCGQPSRNMAAKSDQPLPDWADCGVDNDAGAVDLQSTKNAKWVAKLGRRTTGSPVVSGGKVFIGTTWEDGREACFFVLTKRPEIDLARSSVPDLPGTIWRVGLSVQLPPFKAIACIL